MSGCGIIPYLFINLSLLFIISSFHGYIFSQMNNLSYILTIIGCYTDFFPLVGSKYKKKKLSLQSLFCHYQFISYKSSNILSSLICLFSLLLIPFSSNTPSQSSLILVRSSYLSHLSLKHSLICSPTIRSSCLPYLSLYHSLSCSPPQTPSFSPHSIYAFIPHDPGSKTSPLLTTGPHLLLTSQVLVLPHLSSYIPPSIDLTYFSSSLQISVLTFINNKVLIYSSPLSPNTFPHVPHDPGPHTLLTSPLTVPSHVPYHKTQAKTTITSPMQVQTH